MHSVTGYKQHRMVFILRKSHKRKAKYVCFFKLYRYCWSLSAPAKHEIEVLTSDSVTIIVELIINLITVYGFPFRIFTNIGKLVGL